MIGKISGSDIIRLGGKIQSSGKSFSQPPGFPKISNEIKNNPGKLLKFYIGIAQDTKYSKDIRNYAALKARREWGLEKKESAQEEISANEQLGEMEQVKTIADTATGGGFSDIVKAEEVFFNKASVTPKEAITAYFDFLKGEGKTILSIGIGTGAIFKVAGKGGTFLFKVIGKKAGKPVLEFIKKVGETGKKFLNKAVSKTPKKTPPTQTTDVLGAQKVRAREAAERALKEKGIDVLKTQKVSTREAMERFLEEKKVKIGNGFNFLKKGEPPTSKVYEHGTGETLELSHEAKIILGLEK